MPECLFCGHSVAAHDWRGARSVVADVPCPECPGGTCQNPGTAERGQASAR